MPSRLPLGLVVLPLLTLLALAFSMLSDLSASRLTYARVWGGPPVGAPALRLQVVEEESGLSRGVSSALVTVEGSAGGVTALRSVRTDSGGFTDVTLPLSTHAEFELVAYRERRAGAPLVRGRVRDVRAAWLASATRVSAPVPADAERPLLAFRFDPPVWSVPFAADLIVELSPRALGPIDLEVHPVGARLLSAAQIHLAPGVPTRVRLQPLEHGSMVSIEASSSPHGRPSRILALPVRPGSLTMVPGPDALTILSPVLRERAYYAVVTQAGRLGGGVVSLGPRPDGTSAGRLARGDLPSGADRYLVLSSAPDGQAPATTGLPLDGQNSTFDAKDLLLLDGRAAALRATERQRLRVRWALSAYAAIGGALCLVLFVWHIRRANERLRADLAEAGAPALARDRSLFGPLCALLCLLFAFGLVLTWILLR